MTFKGAQTLLQKLFGPNSPTWKFSAPLAPWWGGWWERLVRTTKTENGEIVRAVQKLHMLEVSVSQSHPENLSKNDKLDESENGEDMETNVEADTRTGTHTGQRFSRKGRLLKSRQILDL